MALRILFTSLLLAVTFAIVEASTPVSQPISNSWTPQEKWVWGQIVAGKVANLAARYGGRATSSGETAQWTQRQILRPLFLEMITREQYQDAIPATGIMIVGARVTDDLTLAERDFSKPLILTSCLFEKSFTLHRATFKKLLAIKYSIVASKLDLHGFAADSSVFMQESRFGSLDLSDGTVSGQILLDNSAVDGDLYAEQLDVEQNFLMRNLQSDGSLVLRGANLRGQLLLNGASIAGSVNLDSAEIGQYLFMKNARAGVVVLRGASVGANVELDNSEIKHVSADAAIVGRHFLLQHARFGSFEAPSAVVKGQFALVDASIAGDFNMEFVSVGQSLLLRRSILRGTTNLIFADTGHGIDLSARELGTVDLSGANIGHELRLRGDSPVVWKEGATLNLTDARATSIADSRDAWPRRLKLRGFRYERFVETESDLVDPMLTRSSSWFIAWLKRQERYNADSYRHLAGVFRNVGRAEEATDVLYAGKREEHRLKGWMGRIVGQISRSVIGYGYREARAGVWLVALAFLGAIVFRRSSYLPQQTFSYALFYSLGMLIPVLTLSDVHNRVEMQRGYQYYLYFHKIAGFVLVSFLLVGLSGLTDL